MASAVIDAWGIDKIWQALGGGQLRRGRGRAFWRNGQGFNVAIDVERGSWWDFARCEGGGKLDLIQRVRGGSREESLKWLSGVTGVSRSTREPLSLEQRRTHARKRAVAAKAARNAGWWHQSLVETLERRKRLCNGIDGPWDDVELETVSSELYRLQQMNVEELLDAWQTAHQTDLVGTRRLEAVGREWETRYDSAVRRIIDQPWRREVADSAT